MRAAILIVEVDDPNIYSQPFMELFRFGLTGAVGMLIDTILIRTIPVPAIIVKLRKFSLWQQKMQSENQKAYPLARSLR